MDSYHGTSINIAIELTNGKVDVSSGGGELGKGFYTGTFLHEAKAWAFQRYGDKKKNVVHFLTLDTDIDVLKYIILENNLANYYCYKIKTSSQTRTYLFYLDMVWAPIVGSARPKGDQYKWESKRAECLLNSNKTNKKVI